MQPETMQYLSDVSNWTNTGFIIQVAAILLVVIGGLMALPDTTSSRFMSRDKLGWLFLVIGVLFILFLLLPAIWPAIVANGLVIIIFGVIIGVLIVIRLISR